MRDEAGVLHLLRSVIYLTVRASRLLLLYFLLLLSQGFISMPGVALEQNVRFKHLGPEQGLSQESILTMLQDHQGYMWFGTQQGLNRYDGYDMRIFTHDDSDPQSLSNDWIFSLAQDNEGNLWVGTDGGGLNLLRAGEDSFTHFVHQPENDNSISGNTVYSMHYSHQGLLWVGTDQGLDSFDPKTGRFTHYINNNINTDSDNLEHKKIRAIAEDDKGLIWVGSHGGGLDVIDPATGNTTHFHHQPGNDSSLSSNNIRSLHFDPAGTLWIGTYESGLNRYDPVNQSITRFSHQPAETDSLANNYIRDIYSDSTGTLWIATDHGLDQWEPDNQSFVHYVNDPVNNHSLVNNYVYSITQDSGGVLWVGTYAGVSKWNITTTGFAHHQKGATTFSFTKDDIGNLWVGTYNGLSRIAPSSDLDSHYGARGTQNNGLSDPRVMSLHYAGNNQLWIGTRSKGLDLLNTATGKFSNFRHQPEQPSSLSHNGITTIHPTSGDRLWIGTFGGGLNLFDPRSNTALHYRHNPEDRTTIGSDRIIAIEDAVADQLWLGSWGGGVSLFDQTTGTATTLQHQPGDITSLSHNTVLSILRDKQGNYWFGTNGGGLNKLSAENFQQGELRFTRYNHKQGLVSNVIWGLLEDDNGKLWLSTNKGLINFDPLTGQSRNFNVSHGLQADEFNQGAAFKDQQGQLYFGGNNGFNTFLPDNIRKNTHIPPVVLTKFLKLNQSISPAGGLANLNNIQLGYRDYLVAFEFAGLDFTEPAHNKYRYQLLGFDEGWIENGSIRRATYTNLPSGDYVFKVEASNNDGVWNKNGIAISVSVSPPPWFSWWAYLLYTAMVVFSIVFLIKRQQRKLQQAVLYQQELEQKVEERTQELKAASVTDPMTGLYNRRYLLNVIDDKVASINGDAERTPDASPPENPTERLFFLMIDVDGFKPVNDTYGHSAGDKIITTVSELLNRESRESDIVIRWGGDEFMIMGKISRAEEVNQLAERLRKTIEDHPFDVGGTMELHLSCSIGFSLYPFHPGYSQLVDWQQVAAIADKALYHSKERGRNCWTSIDAAQGEPPVQLMDWINQDLPRAVDRGYVHLTSSIDRKLHPLVG